MQTESKILDDLARLVGGAVGAANGARQELEQIIRARMERMLAHMDLVPREEFEAVRTMAIKAREEQEVLAARIAALEEKLAATSAAAAPAAPARRRKPAAKS
ncbi:accessory factor UbiK family protein [Radicibacter daui]|uniref:accessory factor UbiK family protein n=1 Tax=Radicibacter daui TaxID=3064829 RepID=UPI004046F1E3